MIALLRLATPGPRALAFVSISLLLFLLQLVHTAFAAGDNIRVVSNEREVHFPDDVVFNLEVEGDSDIVEVRLYYRVPPSGTWAYAYLNLTPSRHVETRFNLNVSGISYLPPGTELEYYYSIQSAQGSSLRTELRKFTYVDDRFQWRTTTTGPLTIFSHDLPRKRVEEVGREVERSLGHVAEVLQLSAVTPLRGIIYNSKAEAREAFPHQSKTTTDKGIFQGFAFPDRGVFVGVGLHPSLIVHESTHLLLEQAVSSPVAMIPAWVNEGFASYMEPRAAGYGRGSLRDTDPSLMPLRHMYSLPGRLEDIRYFYRKAESVVGYMIEDYGAESFRTFLGILNEGKVAEEALTAAYGFGTDELDRLWSSSTHPAPASSSGGGDTRFAYFDTLLIAVLLLVGMGVLGTGVAMRRLKRKAAGPAEWERLTEGEWEDRP